MSQVQVAGGASGTGVFQIVSPNSSTNRTQTLADATGTIVLDSATQTLTNKTLGSGLVAGASLITSGTAVASTSGTSIDFTSIPSWVKRITVLFNGVSTSGTSNPQIQVGAGSITSSGYVGYGQNITTAPASTTVAAGTGWIISSATAANSMYGLYVIANISGNNWVISGAQNQASNASSMLNGSVALSGTLDRVRITTVGGTDTFDAGSINILYE